MDKVLKLYKIPDSDLIMRVLGITNPAPSNPDVGDYYINSVSKHLYEAQDVGGVATWVQVAWDSDKYYLDTSTPTPNFYKFDSVSSYIVEYDVDFPATGMASEIYDFTYSASRMGNAPTISATFKHRTCLDELWTDRCCVYFNKVFYFIDKIPASKYSNAEQRYEHTLSLVSERLLLEHVFFANAIDPEDVSGTPQLLEFTFFANLQEFVTRLNKSLTYSGLGTQGIGFSVVIDTAAQQYINQNVAEPWQNISISDTTLKSALDLIYETWGVPYYFDGYTIHIGFSNAPQMSAAGVVMPTFQYGALNSLLSIQKTQNNDIINRITGVGSGDNLPYFYPNKNPNNLDLVYERSSSLMVNYAKIANPYRLTGLEPTSEVHQGIPNGSFFKFMPIQKTYTFDQFVTINPNYINELHDGADGVPQLVVVPQELDDFIVKYHVQAYNPAGFGNNGANQKTQFKYVWVWLKDGDFQNLSFKDDWKGLFLNYVQGYLKVDAKSLTHEQFLAAAESTYAFNENTTANVLDLTYTHNIGTGITTWSDGETTEGYEARMPIEIDSIPNGTTCLLFTFARRYETYMYWSDSEALTFLKNDTRFSCVQTYIDSNPDWSFNGDGHVTQLRNYGIKLLSGVTPVENDLIYFTRDTDVVPNQQSLLPWRWRNAGDPWFNALNNTYLKSDGQEYYDFENLYKQSCAKEAIEKHDEIKPTIKGITNTDISPKRIDKFLDIAFDQNDNNELDASGEKYLHPYFFVKLAKTAVADGYGFNLFDCAVDGQTMKISMTSGLCGGCEFDVLVKYGKDGYARNPVGVFTEATTINGVTYAAGTPKRDITTGDVLVNQLQDIQQDTEQNEVWIALKKDNTTHSDVVYPDSTASTPIVPTTSDTFVILNINLPFAYVIAAEKKLDFALLDSLEDKNKRLWAFSIRFSSIYYKQQYALMDKWLNESAKVPFIYNTITRNYYVQSYSYKMSNTSPLPEVTIELQEKVKTKKNLYPITPGDQLNVVAQAVQNAIKSLKKEIGGGSVLGDSATPSSIEVTNIQVLGDITMGNGVGVGSQITELNQQIFDTQQAQKIEKVWATVGNRVEINNLFVDGAFCFDYNTNTARNATAEDDETVSLFGDTSKKLDFDEGGIVIFDQQIEVEELSKYTYSFYGTNSELEEDATIKAYFEVLFFDEKNQVIDSMGVDAEISNVWKNFVMTFDTPRNTKYAQLRFSVIE